MSAHWPTWSSQDTQSSSGSLTWSYWPHPLCLVTCSEVQEIRMWTSLGATPQPSTPSFWVTASWCKYLPHCQTRDLAEERAALADLQPQWPPHPQHTCPSSSVLTGTWLQAALCSGPAHVSASTGWGASPLFLSSTALVKGPAKDSRKKRLRRCWFPHLQPNAE